MLVIISCDTRLTLKISLWKNPKCSENILFSVWKRLFCEKSWKNSKLHWLYEKTAYFLYLRRKKLQQLVDKRLCCNQERETKKKKKMAASFVLNLSVFFVKDKYLFKCAIIFFKDGLKCSSFDIRSKMYFTIKNALFHWDGHVFDAFCFVFQFQINGSVNICLIRCQTKSNSIFLFFYISLSFSLLLFFLWHEKPGTKLHFALELNRKKRIFYFETFYWLYCVSNEFSFQFLHSAVINKYSHLGPNNFRSIKVIHTYFFLFLLFFCPYRFSVDTIAFKLDRIQIILQPFHKIVFFVSSVQVESFNIWIVLNKTMAIKSCYVGTFVFAVSPHLQIEKIEFS